MKCPALALSALTAVSCAAGVGPGAITSSSCFFLLSLGTGLLCGSAAAFGALGGLGGGFGGFHTYVHISI